MNNIKPQRKYKYTNILTIFLLFSGCAQENSTPIEVKTAEATTKSVTPQKASKIKQDTIEASKPVAGTTKEIITFREIPLGCYATPPPHLPAR